MRRLDPGRGGRRAALLRQLVLSDAQLVVGEGRGARAGRPGQTGGHLALVGAPGAPAGRHGGEGRVGVVAQGVGRLQGQRLDAVGQQAAGRIVIVVGQVQLVGAGLLHRRHEPTLGGGGGRGGGGAGVLALRRQEAVGLRDSALAAVKAVLRQVVDKLVLEKGLHGVAGAWHDLGGAGRVGGRRGQPVALRRRVHPGETEVSISNEGALKKKCAKKKCRVTIAGRHKRPQGTYES